MNTVRVIARTVEEIVTDTDKMITEFNEFSGRAAGFCYMTDDYEALCEQGNERAISRAKGTAKRGHTSVLGHAVVSLELNIPKALAMVLNSLGVYNTSEKSARYTKMEPETDRERFLYEKWVQKIQQNILHKYPSYDDEFIKKYLKQITDMPNEWNYIVSNGAVVIQNLTHKSVYGMQEMNTKINEMVDVIKKRNDIPSIKLAMENARYMLSVFTPTSMVYTVSYRQLCLIVDYLDKLVNDCNTIYNNSFYRMLREPAYELSRQLKGILGNDRIMHDNKNQRIRFLLDTYTDCKKAEVIGDSYTVTYAESFAAIAQAERHRTIRYSISVPEDNNRDYFIPPILEDKSDIEEWIEDIRSIEYCVPQGTLVNVTEQGIFEDFALKCKERLCGRAQLEIMVNTKQTLQKFIDNEDKLCKYNVELLHSMIDCENGSTKIKPRCAFSDFKCTDGCTWGKISGVDRLI